MALIGKIRNNFWFVLLVLGLALAAFVIMDMMNAGNQGGLGPKQIIGEVAGTEIDYRDFQKAEQALYSGGTDSYAGKTSAWNYLTEKAIVEDQSSRLGIGVSGDELSELLFGSQLSPVIQNVYRNPQTGQVDMQSLLGIKQALQDGNELNPDFVLRWEELQKQVIKVAKQEKINALVSKSIFTPKFVAENVGMKTSEKVSFNFVKIPFDNIDDSAITLDDADYSSYISDNAFKYTNQEETRVLEYAVLNVLPTAKDSANIMADLAERADEFRSKSSSTEDSLYVINNEGFYSPFYARQDDLTGAIKNAIVDMNVGDVYGPYLDNGGYFIAKLTAKGVIPDSVQASHILRPATQGDVLGMASARAYIDSLRVLVENRTADFADLAIANSTDGSAAQGGDLGTFAQGRMVPEFNKAAFVDSKEGGLYTVQTQYGVHLINVKKKVFNDRDSKYKIALIRSAIVPSEETQNVVYEVADQIVSANRTLEELRTAVEGKANMSIERTSPLKANDYLVGALGGGETSREIVRWAYDMDSKAGEVSPSIYTYTDLVNYYNSKYVLAGLASITAGGLSTVADLKNDIETPVMNLKKGALIASKISGTDLASIANNFSTSVETANDVAFTAGGVTGLGNEPKVLTAAFGQAEGSVSKPIIGNNGVYVVRTNSKTAGSAPANVLAQTKTLNNTNRGRVNFSLLNSLKEKFKATDNRSKYF
ncbi:MAG: peptidyl-prolyl cis-trans isomerase D [Saprospiraceae bacterium]|jgi:peptidyl-prolyl cis-trans isomerase D